MFFWMFWNNLSRRLHDQKGRGEREWQRDRERERVSKSERDIEQEGDRDIRYLSTYFENHFSEFSVLLFAKFPISIISFIDLGSQAFLFPLIFGTISITSSSHLKCDKSTSPVFAESGQPWPAFEGIQKKTHQDQPKEAVDLLLVEPQITEISDAVCMWQMPWTFPGFKNIQRCLMSLTRQSQILRSSLFFVSTRAACANQITGDLGVSHGLALATLSMICTESAPSHLCNSICSKASIPLSSGYRRKVANQVASVEFNEYIRIRMSSKCQVNVKLADIHQHLTIASFWGHVVSEERSFAFLPSSFPLPLAGPHEYHKAKSRPSRNIFDLSGKSRGSNHRTSLRPQLKPESLPHQNVRDNQTTCATCVNQSLKPRCSRPLPWQEMNHPRSWISVMASVPVRCEHRHTVNTELTHKHTQTHTQRRLDFVSLACPSLRPRWASKWKSKPVKQMPNKVGIS